MFGKLIIYNCQWGVCVAWKWSNKNTSWNKVVIGIQQYFRDVICEWPLTLCTTLFTRSLTRSRCRNVGGWCSKTRNKFYVLSHHKSELNLTLSLSLSHTHTHTHGNTRTLFISLSLSLTHTNTHKPPHFLSIKHTQTLTHALSLSLVLSLSHTHTHAHSQKHSNTFSLSHTHTHTHTNTLTLFLYHTHTQTLPLTHTHTQTRICLLHLSFFPFSSHSLLFSPFLLNVATFYCI